MLGRSIFQLGVCCLLLTACKGNYPKKPGAAADGGSSECEDMPCADAGTASGGSGSAGHAGGAARSRTQAMQIAKDAGAASSMDDAAAKQDGEPAQPDKPSKPQNQGSGGSGGSADKSAANSGKKSNQPGHSGAGAGGGTQPTMSMSSMSMTPAHKEEAGQGGANGGAGGSGADRGDDKQKAECEPTCGPCQACGDDNKTCGPVTGRDDADSCSDSRSCSSRGECLHISEAQAELGDSQDYAELTQSYAQVLTFSEPATIQEIRLEVSCNENDQTFPAVWLAAAPGGIPSDTILATANVLYQAPTDSHAFALLELSKTLEEPATGPIAIVVSQSDMSCTIRLNKQAPYPNGALFTQAGAIWAPSEGSMVFQVLSSQ